jgi:uncharacterized protein (TIGR00369 family)
MDEELFSDDAAASNCFCCGGQNPHGLHLRFVRDGEKGVRTTVTLPDYWTGWGRILHGGFQSLLLDETTSWAAYGALGERSFVTRDIAVRFLKPVYVGKPLTVVAHVTEDRGKTLLVHGEIRDESGQVLSSAEATLQRIDPKNRAAVIGK